MSPTVYALASVGLGLGLLSLALRRRRMLRLHGIRPLNDAYLCIIDGAAVGLILSGVLLVVIDAILSLGG